MPDLTETPAGQETDANVVALRPGLPPLPARMRKLAGDTFAQETIDTARAALAKAERRS